MVRFIVASVELLEGTRRGSVLSTMVAFTTGLLFFLGTNASLPSLKTSLALDSNSEMDFKCEFATIDVLSVAGTQQTATQHVHKLPIDQNSSIRQRYSSRNLKQQHDDVQLFDSTVDSTTEDLHADGNHDAVISLDATTLQVALEENTYVFVDFYADSCSYCRDLAPAWETLAEVMHDATGEKGREELHRESEDRGYTDEEYRAASDVGAPVFIGKVDCVHHQQLCVSRGIRAYPTLKFFANGQELGDYLQLGDYLGRWTVVELAQFIENMEEHHNADVYFDFLFLSSLLRTFFWVIVALSVWGRISRDENLLRISRDENLPKWTEYEWDAATGTMGTTYGSTGSSVIPTGVEDNQDKPVGMEDNQDKHSVSNMEDGRPSRCDEEEATCSICLCEYELGERVARLPCGHIYHVSCIKPWTDTKSTCPLCNYNLDVQHPLPG